MTNSEARKRMQAQSPAESAASMDDSPSTAPNPTPPPSGPYAANLGDGANGLSEAERAGFWAIFEDYRRGRFTTPNPILALAERIVREHTERAWDEGFTLADRLWQGSEYNEVTWAPDLTANPYRAARQEQS